MLEGHEDKLDVVLFENEEKGEQYKLCITEFRGKNYLSIRKWFLDFEGEYKPTKNGFTMEYTLVGTANLFSALAKLLSEAESLETILSETQNERTTRDV